MFQNSWDGRPVNGFWVFEGIDGAGTTTQARRLVDWLNEAGRPAEFTAEPSTGPIGSLIRSVLLDRSVSNHESIALLYAADRSHHIFAENHGVLARVDAGLTIVCDRYFFSSLAYQGALVDPAWVERLNSHYPLPERLFFVDTPQPEAERRLSQRATRDMLEVPEIQLMVEDRYRDIIAEFSERSAIKVHYLDGSGSQDEIFRRIVRVVSED